MSEATKYAPGELNLLAFAEAWAAYCEERGLVWPAPKIAVEDERAVARFVDLRVSVMSLPGFADEALAWCTSESMANWVPMVLWESNAADFCGKLADVLDRRIPW